MPTVPTAPVALKLIDRIGLDGQQRAFFEVERQMLAQMRHPVIALITMPEPTDDRPRLVMQCIEGEPISLLRESRAAARHLALFLRVCDGSSMRTETWCTVIKPANVLVEG